MTDSKQSSYAKILTIYSVIEWFRFMLVSFLSFIGNSLPLYSPYNNILIQDNLEKSTKKSPKHSPCDLHETRERIRLKLLKELTHFKKTYKNPIHYRNFEKYIFPALERRINTISVRSSFVILLYKLLSKNTDDKYIDITEDKLIKLAFLCDLVMTSLYMYNHIYDHKYGINSKKTREHLGASNILNNLVYHYTIKEFPNQANIIQAKLFDTFNEVDHGQLMDQQYNFIQFDGDHNSFGNLFEFKEERLHLVKDLIDQHKRMAPNKSNSIDIYFTRIYLISSSLFRAFTEILIELMAIEDKELIDQVTGYAEVYGLMMQIINDNADFVLDRDTSNKKGKDDVLSDLKNQTITLPMIHFLESNFQGKWLRNYFKHVLTSEAYKSKKLNYVTYYQYKLQSFFSTIFINPKFNLFSNTSFRLRGYHNEVLEEMIKSKALSKTIKLGNQLKEICEQQIKHLKGSEHLQLATSIANYNRYYFHIYKAKKAYKQGLPYRCEDHPSQ